MTSELNLNQIKKEWHGTLKSYWIGFVLSILLTAAAFGLVHIKPFSTPTVAITIVSLAVVQAVVQLLFFLHVGKEPKPRWETLIFCFMLLVLLIIAIGSLWIMYDLDDRLMSDMQMEMSHD